ncbi:MAG TPA: alpha/beta hydrolase [Pseudonocardiaceae bacterium]|nr:alpha/beta hydrolase [Pseudonocardiaceae bacterium]
MSTPEPTVRKIQSGPVALSVAEHVGTERHDTPVLLIHGWPDSGYLWRHQVDFLVRQGFRVIVPDLRGFGASERPSEAADYAIGKSVADMTTILDAVGVSAAHVVGHDWGAVVAWSLAATQPDRVRTLTALSVPHPGARRTLRQSEMAWYQLFFQFEGVAEATIQADDFAWLRWLMRGGEGDFDRYVVDLARPGALTASLNWYRANLAPRPPGSAPRLPAVAAPTMGIWSDGDHFLDGERMAASGEFVIGKWRHEVISGASHWIPVDAPDRLNELLGDWLS